MKKRGIATFQDLVDMCNKVGWDKGIKSLEKIVLQNENYQAHLFSNPETVGAAQKLGQTIIAQNFAIGNLKMRRKELEILTPPQS